MIEQVLRSQIINQYEAFQSGLPLDQQTRNLTAQEKSFIRRCGDWKKASRESRPRMHSGSLNWNLRQIREAATDFGLSGEWADSLDRRRWTGRTKPPRSRSSLLSPRTGGANRGYGLHIQLRKFGAELAKEKCAKELGAVLARYEAFQEFLPAERRRPDLKRPKRFSSSSASSRRRRRGRHSGDWPRNRPLEPGYIRELGREIKMTVELRDALIKHPSLSPDITTDEDQLRAGRPRI